jgi:hypothetical protein
MHDFLQPSLWSPCSAASSVPLTLEQVESVEIALDVEASCYAQQGTPQIWHVYWDILILEWPL